MIQERNIVACILLSLVTFGIYGIYWFIVMTNEVASANDDPNFTGGKAFLLTIVTCGIYGLYWYYKLGKELYEAKQKKNMGGSDNSVLFLILGVVGLGIVSICIAQLELNEMARTAA